MKNKYLTILCISILFSCAKESDQPKVLAPNLGELPLGFPDIDYPLDNEYTHYRWLLGKKLFYDTILSKDRNVSCASCHDAKLAFSDKVDLSIGSDDEIGTRNSPTLANVAYHPYYTREGGIPTLEMQILVPIQEHNEFNTNILLIADTLSKISSYIEMARRAYDREIDPYVITRALANFERTLISGQSHYDMEYHYQISGAMSESAKRGQLLFESDKTNCTGCHSGFNFTNYAFENNGLYTEYDDIGRARLTNNDEDIALFKVPTLRNIELTAPYMHDGKIKTLVEVIEHYNSGGKDHVNKSLLIKPLNLSDNEKDDLLAFLHSLTDINFIQNENLQDE